MSLKPLKKSDLAKGWMKKRGGKPIKILPEYHLIVTEGTDTEPLYFQAIKDTINGQYRNRIQLDISGEGDNTIRLFERARQLAVESANGYKHIWVVYDTDDFPAEHINRAAELCAQSSTEESTYHAVWSNQCIELWFLLHFGYFHSDIHRNEYWSKLSKCLADYGKGDYEKNRPDMYAILRPFVATAIRNARRLDVENEGKQPSEAAPGTKVYELLERLEPYLNPAE